jgi:hypothetical protein
MKEKIKKNRKNIKKRGEKIEWRDKILHGWNSITKFTSTTTSNKNSRC